MSSARTWPCSSELHLPASFCSRSNLIPSSSIIYSKCRMDPIFPRQFRSSPTCSCHLQPPRSPISTSIPSPAAPSPFLLSPLVPLSFSLISNLRTLLHPWSHPISLLDIRSGSSPQNPHPPNSQLPIPFLYSSAIPRSILHDIIVKILKRRTSYFIVRYKR